MGGAVLRGAPRSAPWLACLFFALVLAAVPAAADVRASGQLSDPVDQSTVEPTFPITGYVYDAQSSSGGSQVDVVHLWALPADGSPGVFLTAITCDPSSACSFSVTASDLTRGTTYTLVAYAHLVATSAFETAATARITVAQDAPDTLVSLGTTRGGGADARSLDPDAVNPYAARAAYDDKHDVYLLVWEHEGDILARFVGFDGGAKGDAFSVATERISLARAPLVVYSRGSIDDVFLVVYGSDALGAGTQNVFTQRVRYTGSGATGGALVGPPVQFPFTRQEETPLDAVFNPIDRRFFVSSRIRTALASGTFESLGRTLVDTTGARPSTTWGLDPRYFNQCGYTWSYRGGRTGYDWRHNVVAWAFEQRKDSAVVSSSCTPYYSTALLVYSSDLSSLITWGSLCGSAAAPCGGAAGVAASPEADGFVAAWNRRPVRESVAALFPTYDVLARRVRAADVSPGSTDTGVVIGTTSDDFSGGLQYDPDTSRLLIAAAAVPVQPGGAAPASGVTVAALDAGGTARTAAIALPTTTAVTSVPDVVAARGGVFALSYTTADGAMLHRVAVSGGTSATVRFSNVTTQIDAPVTPVGSAFTVSGWAVDFGASTGTGIDAVQVLSSQGGGPPVLLGSISSFVARPDVVALVGDRFANTGFSFRANGMHAGTYTISVQAHSTVTGAWATAQTVSVTVTSRPILTLDAPGNSVPPVFDAGGWAIDLGAADGQTGIDAIHVYALPAGGSAAAFLGATTPSRPRPDIASVYGSQFANSGYRMTTPALAIGDYTLIVYAHSTVSDGWTWQTRAITVRTAGRSAMAIDTPPDHAVTRQPFPIAGWALDLDALEAQGAGVDAVQVWAIDSHGAGTFVGATTTGDARPDVGTAFGAQFATAGYHLTASGLAPGDYTLVVYAHSVVTNTWFWQTRAITVRTAGNPVMALDTPSDQATTGQPFVIAGWAIDLDATTGPGVDVLHVWAIDAKGAGTFVGATTTGGSRPDVGTAFGSQFATAGYSLTASGLTTGTYQLIIYAHSTVTDTFSQARVATVTVQ